MMIGVAQVIGMKPTASLVFSSGPDCAKASVAVAIGKICASAAETVALPTAVSSDLRVIASGKAARSTARSTRPRRPASLKPSQTKLASWSAPQAQAFMPVGVLSDIGYPCVMRGGGAACWPRRTGEMAQAALPCMALGVAGWPSSIGSDGSRDHSFQEPKYMRTSFTPAFLSARKVLDARAPLKQ